MASGRVFKLNTGSTIPAIGFGTWQSQPDDAYNSVLTAIKIGYRHIDTAVYYNNEKEIGRAIKDSGIPRKEFFITTKLWNTFHRPDLVSKAFEESLAKLQLDYLDLYEMHWPCAFIYDGDNLLPRHENGKIILDHTVDFTETYAEMEKLIEGGKVRAIGVSNFSVRNLKKLLKTAKIIPAVNQCELHPYFPQNKLLDFCTAHNIHMTGYSPLGSSDSPLMKNNIVIDIAKKYNVTPAQILISWGIQRGTSVIPKSITPSRIQENFKDIALEQVDFDKLSSLGTTNPQRLIIPNNWDCDEFIYGEDIEDDN
ncbi:NADP-dependent oxidoreductase domain-containing protein [Circinella umbellata]|nr:NADP-dependent oxidoreductase domain-containing protein [Circinella umbellata]